MSLFARLHRTLAPCFALAVALAAAPAPAADPVTVADFQLPPQDAAGWTRLSPSADSRLVYVDSQQGNDADARIYLPADPQIGADPQSPRGPIRAFRTIAAAHANLREDQPDWILLRAGRVWNERLDIKRGRSPAERAVATSWGAGPRPELRTGTDKAIGNYQLVNVAIVGLRFWAHTRDSDGPYFTGFDGSSGISVFTRLRGDRRQVRDVLIEDCVFRAYSNNVLTGGLGDGNEPITRFVIRRSILSGNYSTSAHAQGLYHTGSGQPLQPSVLLQENLFDHNGWRIQSRDGNNAQAEGQATMFNHNTYFSFAKGVIFQRNLFLRASSIGNKWTGDTGDPTLGVVMEDNLYVEGEIGVSVGGNSEGPARFRDMVFRDNVLVDIGRSRPTNRSLAWGIDLIDWLGGEVTGNLVIHNRSGITNAYALKTDSGTRFEDVVISGNVLAFATGTGTPSVQLGDGVNVVYRDNTVVSPSNSRLVRLAGGGYTFAGTNRYVSGASQAFQVDGTLRTLAQWRSDTGDQGATGSMPAFPAPQRDLEGYAATLGLDGFQGLLDAFHAQSKATWNAALTAGAINDWLRAGYGMAPLQPRRVRRNGATPLAPPAASSTTAAAPPPVPAAVSAAARASATPATADGDVAMPAPARRATGLHDLLLRLLPFLADDGDRSRTREAHRDRR